MGSDRDFYRDCDTDFGRDFRILKLEQIAGPSAGPSVERSAEQSAVQSAAATEGEELGEAARRAHIVVSSIAAAAVFLDKLRAAEFAAERL